MKINLFDFKVLNSCSKTSARTGVLNLPRGDVKTPVFMPCGTKGMVKTMLPSELESLGVQIMLGNTYHLYLRPGDKLIGEKGGLADWNGWQRPMLTDSGGFQVFSLQETKTHSGKSLVKIDEKGVEFRSYLDGSKHYFTPKKAIEIQYNLGADIMMAFDECAPAGVDKVYAKQAMTRTHNWFEECWETHSMLEEQRKVGHPQALFPIIQGAVYLDLRRESAKFLNSFPTKGIAIGGLSVGESKETMHEVLEAVVPCLDVHKPRYLMGVGSPEDIIEAVARGIDMMDCVLPTRLARHGAFWDQYGRQNIKLKRYTNMSGPLMEGCDCLCCQKFERSFIRHLFIEKEITALRLLTIHNLRYLTRLMANIRAAVKDDRFEELRSEFWSTWGKQ